MTGSPGGVAIGAWRVLSLALRTQTLDRRSMLPILLLAVLPAGAMLGNPILPPLQGNAPPGVVIFHAQYAADYLGSLTLLTTLLLATAAIGEELERRTMIHLLIRPIARGGVYFGKLAWIVLMAWGGLALSATICLVALTTRVGGDFGLAYLAWFLCALAGAALLYGALFFAIALLLPFPTVAGLGYGFGVEMVLARLPGYFAWASIGFHIRTLLDRQIGTLHPALIEQPGSHPLAALVEVNAPGTAQSLSLLAGILIAAVVCGCSLMVFRDFSGRMGQAE